MYKAVYKSVKVIYNAHTEGFEVYYRNWFRWRFDREYKVSQYLTKEKAKELAVERAQGLLATVEVWKQSNICYY